ncbi:MAG TPA: sodium:calcium antiporter [Chitinophagales bacterium]|nr:sodium:calcium antiporter [Chitinophagales bacterium]
MIESLSFPYLLLIFAACATAIWFAGIQLSFTTDILSTRFGIGEAFGGLIILAIVTNLPETAITVSAAIHHNLELAIGNILGGIAIQTVVLVVLDAFGLGKTDALTYKAASLVLVLEGLMVITVLTLVVIGNQLNASVIYFGISPVEAAIAVVWVVGIFLIGKARTNLPWHEKGTAPGSQKEPRGHSMKKRHEEAIKRGMSTPKIITIFIICSVITLVGGVGLEVTGEAIAKEIGMTGVLFGATILAAATALPEISTGLASMKLKDYQMAVSDIFGGNAFLPVLFLVATSISGKSVLPQAQKTDIYLTALAILLTNIYVCGLIFRPRRQLMRMGIDSFLVMLIYLLGVLGLFAISS